MFLYNINMKNLSEPLTKIQCCDYRETVHICISYEVILYATSFKVRYNCDILGLANINRLCFIF